MEQNKSRKTENMKEYMKNYNKLYYKKRLDKYREKMVCECGLEVNKYGLLAHLKSSRHKLLIQNMELKFALYSKDKF